MLVTGQDCHLTSGCWDDVSCTYSGSCSRVLCVRILYCFSAKTVCVLDHVYLTLFCLAHGLVWTTLPWELFHLHFFIGKEKKKYQLMFCSWPVQSWMLLLRKNELVCENKLRTEFFSSQISCSSNGYKSFLQSWNVSVYDQQQACRSA